MLVYVISEGIPVAQVSAAEIAGAFVIWGVLMGFTGAAMMWLLSGERRYDGTDRTYRPGRYGRGRARKGEAVPDLAVTVELNVDGRLTEVARTSRTLHARTLNATAHLAPPPPARGRAVHDQTTATLPRVADEVVTVTNLAASARRAARR